MKPFLDAHPELEPEALPPWADPFVDGVFVRVVPARHRMDSFFAARLRRAG